MKIETAARPQTRQPAEQQPDTWRRIGERGRPLVMVLFLVSLMVPIIVYVGALRLLPHRLFLLIVFLPLLARLLTGRAGGVHAPDYLVAGSVIWAALAIFVSQPDPAAIEPIGIYVVEFFGAYVLGRVTIRSAEDFRRFVRVLFSIVLVLIPFAALESVLHRAILLELIPLSHGVVDGGGPRFGLRRAQTLFAHPILFGAFVSAGLGICWYALKPMAGFGTRLLIAATIFTATFFSLSSGAIVAFAIQTGMILWDLLFRRISGHWRIFGWLAAAGYVVLDLLSNRSPFHLLVDYATFSSTTGYYRIIIWRWGIENVQDNPLFGLGLNIHQWERASWMHGSIDNFWLMIAMQYGLPSFLMLAGAIFVMLRRITRARLTDPSDQACRTGYAISLAGVIIAGGTVHYWHAAMAFFIFLIGAGMWMTTDKTAQGSATAKVDAPKELRKKKEGAPRPSSEKPSRPRTWL